MGVFSHVCPLTWTILIASLMTAMGDTAVDTFPAVFENPTLATSLEATIKWKLWEGNNRSSLGSIGGGHFDVAGDVATEHLTSSDPYLVSGAVNTVAYPDGFWTLAWSLEYNNCSSLINGETFFTVFKSGQAPNLVAATSTDVCDTTMPKHSI